MTGAKGRILIFIIYAVVNFVLYLNSLNNFFTSDDFLLLAHASKGTLSDIFVSDVHYLRPVRMLIYTALWQIGGLKPFIYIFFNIIVHSLASFTVFMLMYQILNRSFPERYGSVHFYASLAAGLLFALHFIHTEAVVWLSSQSELVFSLLVLYCLYLFFKMENKDRVIKTIFILLLYIIALFTKETSFSLILLILFSIILNIKEKNKDNIKLSVFLFIITVLFYVIKFLLTPEATGLFNELSLTMIIAESIKNLIFSISGSLFAVDFNGIKLLYQTMKPDILGLAQVLIQEKPIDSALIAVSVLIYLYSLIFGDRLMKYFTLFILATTIPFMWVAGFERYLYLPSAGMCMLIAYLIVVKINLRYSIIYLLLFIITGYFVWNTAMKKDDWEIAQEESRKIVTQMVSIGGSVNSGDTIIFKELPDNYNGAWIMRMGVEYIPELYIKDRKPVFIKHENDTLAETKSKNAQLFIYRNGKLESVN